MGLIGFSYQALNLEEIRRDQIQKCDDLPKILDVSTVSSLI